MPGKTIVIISPESWGKSKISKHHYALAYAKQGFRVFFLNIITGKDNKDDEICSDDKQITLTYIKLPKIVNTLRFHSRKLYNYAIKILVKGWVKKHPKLDYAMSFDCNGVFTDLSHFGAKKTIFFPVDQVNAKYRKEYKGFDKLVSISPVILRAFPDVKAQELFHHGLSPYFMEKDYDYKNIEDVKTIAYVGNLLIGPILDRPVIKHIIEGHTDLEFHFYGAYSPKGNNLGASISKEATDFIDFLKSSSNCHLHGIVTPQELANAYKDVDAFLVCYNYEFDKNECSNSHKIMEYLSTGKPIISTRISMYDNLDLFPMLPTFDNTSFPEFFNEQIRRFNTIYNIESFNKRIDFAKENSYDNKSIKVLG